MNIHMNIHPDVARHAPPPPPRPAPPREAFAWRPRWTGISAALAWLFPLPATLFLKAAFSLLPALGEEAYEAARYLAFGTPGAPGFQTVCVLGAWGAVLALRFMWRVLWQDDEERREHAFWVRALVAACLAALLADRTLAYALGGATDVQTVMAQRTVVRGWAWPPLVLFVSVLLPWRLKRVPPPGASEER